MQDDRSIELTEEQDAREAAAARGESHFRVTWEIDAFGKTHEDAARFARAAQVRPGTTATVFTVQAEGEPPVTVDLTELDEAAPAPELVLLHMRLIGADADQDQVASFRVDPKRLMELIRVCRTNGISEAVIPIPDDVVFKDIRRFDGVRPADGFLLDEEPSGTKMYDAFGMYEGEAEDVGEDDDISQVKMQAIHVDANGGICLEVSTHAGDGPYWSGVFPVENIPGAI
jgi:hypothetical protein